MECVRTPLLGLIQVRNRSVLAWDGANGEEWKLRAWKCLSSNQSDFL